MRSSHFSVLSVLCIGILLKLVLLVHFNQKRQIVHYTAQQKQQIFNGGQYSSIFNGNNDGLILFSPSNQQNNPRIIYADSPFDLWFDCDTNSGTFNNNTNEYGNDKAKGSYTDSSSSCNPALLDVRSEPPRQFSFHSRHRWNGSRQSIRLQVSWSAAGRKTVIVSKRRHRSTLALMEIIRIRFLVVKPLICHDTTNGPVEIDFHQLKPRIRHGRPSSHRVTYCTPNCRLVDWKHQSNRWLWQNVSLIMVGNSHIRNLFRCTAEQLSNHRSANDSRLCDSHNSDPTKGGHCFDCRNTDSLHNFDYAFSLGSLRLETYWTVVWSLDGVESQSLNNNSVSVCRNSTSDHAAARSIVNQRLFPDRCTGPSSTDEKLLANSQLIGEYCRTVATSVGYSSYKVHHNDPDQLVSPGNRCLINQKLARNNAYRYTGPRVGLQFLRNAIVPRLMRDSGSYFVFNIYREPSIVGQILLIIKNNDDEVAAADEKTRLFGRFIMIIDPKASDENFQSAINQWQTAGQPVIDLRHAYTQYAKQRLVDHSGPGWNSDMSHLAVPLQRLLVDHLLSAILRHRYHYTTKNSAAAAQHKRSPLKLRRRCDLISVDQKN